jgi:aspartate/methionine/tyrosine aminotransferase
MFRFLEKDNVDVSSSPLLGIKAPDPVNAAHASSSSDIKTAIDPIQLLNIRAKEVAQVTGKTVYRAGMGNPGAAINDKAALAGVEFWQGMLTEATSMQQCLEQMRSIKKSTLLREQNDDVFIEDIESMVTRMSPDREAPGSPRALTAEGFSQFYNLTASTVIRPENILFPMGGGGGLRAMFEICEGSIVVREPYYTLYVGPNSKNNLITYQTILEEKTRGKRSFKEVMVDIEAHKKNVSFFLFCNPDNPTGKVYSEKEWENITENVRPLIERSEECYMGVDEAYGELNYSQHPSLLEFIYKKLVQIENTLTGKKQGKERDFYQKLLDRLVIFRSGTKALSASGLRMSAMIVFNEKLREKLEKKTQAIGSLPTHLKLAYATAVSHFNMRLQGSWLQGLNEFYQVQVRHAETRARKLGIAIFNAEGQFEKVEGTFYIRINLGELIGFNVEEHGIREQLKKWGLNYKKLETDVDIAYFLLAKFRIMLAPLSFFGVDPKEGILRVTCSEGIDFLDKIFDKLKDFLVKVSAKKARREVADSPINCPSPPLLNQRGLKDDSPFQETNMLPPEIFAYYMKRYWQRICTGAEQAKMLQEKSLKDGVKEFFKEALVLSITEAFSITPGRVLSPLAEKLYLQTSAALERVILMTIKYLRDNHTALWGEIKATNFSATWQDSLFQTDEIIIENAPLFGTCIESFNRSYGAEKSKPYLELLADLGFEIIFSQIKTKGERAPFYSNVFEIYTAQPKTELIQQIVDLRAAVDYSLPQGETRAAERMAKSLNRWYGCGSISPQDILFFSVEWATLIKNVFAHREGQRRVVNWGSPDTILNINSIQETEKPIAILFCVFGEKVGAFLDREQLEGSVDELQKILVERKNFYLVVNESYAERCYQGEAIDFDARSIVSTLIKNADFPRDRLVIIRSALGIFTTEKAKISVLVISNNALMQVAVAESVNMHGHAPADLQDAYSRSLEAWLQGLDLKSDYRSVSEKYIQVLCKYELHQARFNKTVEQVEDRAVYVGDQNTEEEPPKMYIDLQQRNLLLAFASGAIKRTASTSSLPLAPQRASLHIEGPSRISSPLLTCSFMIQREKLADKGSKGAKKNAITLRSVSSS